MSLADAERPRLLSGDLPSLHRAAAVTSLEGQRRYLRGLRGILAGAVVAAIAGALAAASDELRGAAYVSGTSFVATIGITAYLAVLRPERAWYDGRAAAESAKSLAWEYAVGGGPFCHSTCTNADALLTERLHEIVTKLRDFSIGAKDDRGEQITPAMRHLRGASLPERRAVYVRDRLENQRSWYANKSLWNRTRYRRWLSVSIAAQVVGVVTAFLVAAGTVRFDASGILAVLAAAIAAWVQAKDHSGIAQAYGIAAQELALARARVESEEAAQEATFAALIDDAEQAISREHTLWLARRGSVLNAG